MNHSKFIKVLPYQKEVWADNYQANGEQDVIDTWRRLAESIASAEVTPEKKKEVEKIMLRHLYDWKFVMGGRINANLGVEGRKGTTVMNCFTNSPVGSKLKDVDSIEGIYSLLKEQAKVLKSEGGYGMNFSWIRPAGTYIHGIGGRTPGVLRFMELWDVSSGIITSGSTKIVGKRKKNEKKKIRKGAQMGVLNCNHPSIYSFIDAKLIPGKFTKFNFSVGITNGFMQAVIDDADWDLIFPDYSHPEYEKVWQGDIDDWIERGLPVDVYETVKARDLWDKIMKATYTRNEPGVLFLDVANEKNPLAYAEKIVESNPCGETLMSGYGTCNLGSINLVKFIDIDEEGAFFDVEAFASSVTAAVRALDNVNDLATVPLEAIKEKMIATRRIGVGVMGLGSIHYMLGIRYGSPESIDLVTKIFKAKARAEIAASAVFGSEKGSFPLFDKDKYFSTKWWKELPLSKEFKDAIEEGGAMRNSHRSVNAPTGNTAIYAGIVSGGIEPVFSKEYVRWSIVNQSEIAEMKQAGIEIPDVTNGEWGETKDFKFSMRGDEQILAAEINGGKYEIDKSRGLTVATEIEDYGWTWAKEHYTDDVLEKMEKKGVFASAEELSIKEHLDVLKTLAPYVDMSTSKTVNCPSDLSYEDFKGIYMDAWKSGIKGLTTYRANTMAAVLEKKDNVKEEQDVMKEVFVKAEGVVAENVKLPTEYYSKGFIRKDNNKKKWYFNIAFADETLKRPFAMFVTTNNRESSDVAESVGVQMKKLIKDEGVSEDLIKSLESKMSGQSNVQKIARYVSMALRHNIEIRKIVGALSDSDDKFSSLLFHTRKVLSMYIEDGITTGEVCPVCGRQLTYQEGCALCMQCGYSKC